MKTNSKPYINGYQYSYANLQIFLNGVVINGITSISYSEEHDAQNLYGIGNTPIGRGTGLHTYSASLSLYKSELLALQSAAGLALGGDITSLPEFTIVVTYGNQQGQVPTTDILENCQFLSNSVDSSSGDASIVSDIPLILSGIKFGVI